jgi:hypothetical protein
MQNIQLDLALQNDLSDYRKRVLLYLALQTFSRVTAKCQSQQNGLLGVLRAARR